MRYRFYANVGGEVIVVRTDSLKACEVLWKEYAVDGTPYAYVTDDEAQCYVMTWNRSGEWRDSDYVA